MRKFNQIITLLAVISLFISTMVFAYDVNSSDDRNTTTITTSTYEQDEVLKAKREKAIAESTRNMEELKKISQSYQLKIDQKKAEELLKLQEELAKQNEKLAELFNNPDPTVPQASTQFPSTVGSGFGGGYGGNMPPAGSTGAFFGEVFTEGEKGIVVIPSSKMTPEEISQIMEDMTVMARIFDKKVGQPPLRASCDRVVIQPYITGRAAFAQNNRATEGIYIDGYGALFLMNVDFPLKETPKIEEKPPKEDFDTTWEQTKNEIYMQQPAVTNRRRLEAAEPSAKYDPEKVSDLKDKIIKSLVHASNIRTLKLDDFIAVSITGPSIYQGEEVTQQMVHMTMGQDAAITRVTSGDKIKPPSFMTIRIKKSALNDLSEGKIEFDQFAKNVEVIIH